MTLEDIAVNFSRGEWRKLEPFQRKLYKEVLLENFRNLEFVGKDTFYDPASNLGIFWSAVIER